MEFEETTMSLDLTPVHRNLHTKVTFLGLEFEDLILVLALAALMNIFGHFVAGNAKVLGMPLSLFMEFVVPLLAVPFLILFKHLALVAGNPAQSEHQMELDNGFPVDPSDRIRIFDNRGDDFH